MAINFKNKETQIINAIADQLGPVSKSALMKADKVLSEKVHLPPSPKKVLEKKDAKAKTTIQFPDKSTAESEQVVESAVFAEAPCNVGVQASMTLNLGNYNSVKIGVSLHMPCLEKDLDTTFEKAQKWVDTKMAKVQGDVLATQTKNDPPF